MKIFWFQWSFNKGTGVATTIKGFKDKKIKYTYECGNAYERFNIEIFDGNKMNSIGNMWSIGGIPDSTTYICDETKIKARYSNLEKNADLYVKTLLS